MSRYHTIAAQIRHAIEQQVYSVGQRLPGVRVLSQQFGVSISTVVQAQGLLEKEGLLEARPRSGYYVTAPKWSKPALPMMPCGELLPLPVTGQELALQLAKATQLHDMIRLGAAVPDQAFLPVRAIQRELARCVRLYPERIARYTFPPGLPELQQQIARRLYFAGINPGPEKILITSGCQEALSLALQTVAKPGDIIAVESPTFYGLLQVIESLGMQVIEIPADPQTGISLAALSLALDAWSVKACVLIPNFSNPLGSLLPDDRKQQLVALAKKRNFVLIEDDIYRDLAFNGQQPASLLQFDPDQSQVIVCSSFSKTIMPGLRVGWLLVPERYFLRAEYLKYVRNLAAPSLSQLGLASYLASGHYERYIRQLPLRYAQQVAQFTYAVSQYFPQGTRVSQPQGGFIIWVELPEGTDTLQLAHLALREKVSIAPGQLFSAAQKYLNFIRLNCAQPWSASMEQAMRTLGRLCACATS